MNSKSLLILLAMIAVPVICNARTPHSDDPNAITVVGNNATGVQLSGWVREYTFLTPDGHKRHVRYLHAMTPVNWYPGPTQPNANIGFYFHSVFHVYDIQIWGGDKILASAKGGRCVTIVGELSNNELGAAPGTGPEALGIDVEKALPCTALSNKK